MLSYPVRLLEWGLVQWYALVMVLGLGRICFLLRSAVAKGLLTTND